ncbi:MAG: phosphodiester glycosidase family protein [Treponema sp.]|nr:phosphodiester glycosidase family protein [Treponema sp.]
MPLYSGREWSLARVRAGTYFLLSLVVSLLLSCVSVSPLTAPPEDFPLRAAAPKELIPRWETFSPGIGYLEGRIGKPRLQLWALRVDLDNPGLEFVVNHGGKDLGVVPGATVSGFVRDYGCIAGINANPFDRVTARPGEPLTVAGIALSEGLLVSPPDSHYDALVFYQKGSAAIVSQGSLDEPALEKVSAAVGGFFILLREGALAERLLNQNGNAPRHPRSAAGLSADGRTLYLLAIDGRRPGSVGATEEETGLILQRLGAADGLNLDGGGSTALVLRRSDGTIRPVNTPIHGMIPGKERVVAACLGIRIKLDPIENPIEGR